MGLDLIKQPGSLTDRIVDQINHLIDDEGLNGGERLPAEREMARMLGVSRPAVREAVKVLEAQGRVVVRHGQGVFVARTAADEVRDRLAALQVNLTELFEMRLVLEEPAALWAAQRSTSDDVADLASALAAEESARQPPVDFEALRALDTAFHMQIVRIAKNRFMHQTLGVLQEMLRSGMETTLSIPGRLTIAREDHRRIFAAIAAHDEQAAAAAMRIHILGARDAALARVRNESGLHGEAGSSETDGHL
jgi:GntR family transcriptional repressor for pyruvate dehydrogenase complex